MEKVLQEFRIIETDDGFRIEIKGDKEQLRDFVMNLDPRHWMHGRRGRGFGFGPWGWREDDDDCGPRHKHKHGHHHHHHGPHGDEEEDMA